eukprot:6392989-Lingulodinium_polyedra.AAC.1
MASAWPPNATCMAIDWMAASGHCVASACPCVHCFIAHLLYVPFRTGFCDAAFWRVEVLP